MRRRIKAVGRSKKCSGPSWCNKAEVEEENEKSETRWDGRRLEFGGWRVE